MKKTFYIIMAVYLILFAIVAKAQTISTFAGLASAGGTYTSQPVLLPMQVAIYISQTGITTLYVK
jgi:hypothetical protein